MPCPTAAPSVGSGQNNPCNFSIRSPTQPRAPGKGGPEHREQLHPIPGWGAECSSCDPPACAAALPFGWDPILSGEPTVQRWVQTRLGLVFPSSCQPGGWEAPGALTHVWKHLHSPGRGVGVSRRMLGAGEGSGGERSSMCGGDARFSANVLPLPLLTGPPPAGET